jgi:hypothetical protein
LKHQPLDLFTASSLPLRDFLICRSSPESTGKARRRRFEQLFLVLESKTKVYPLTKQTDTTQSGSKQQ